MAWLMVVLNYPKDPFVCPKVSGLPRTIPMTWGWDVSTINPIRSGGVWILSDIFCCLNIHIEQVSRIYFYQDLYTHELVFM